MERSQRQEAEEDYAEEEQEPEKEADIGFPKGIQGQVSAKPEFVKFPSGKLTLWGAVWMPMGKGPFPAMIYNHGSEKDPALTGPHGGYSSVGQFYAQHGFICMIPLRRGHSFKIQHNLAYTSEGEFFKDRFSKLAGSSTDHQEKNKIWLEQQDVDNEDVVAAVAWLRQQSNVNPSKLAMSGISIGGLQTVLTSAKGLGLRAFVPFSPGAKSWRGNPALHEREAHALERAAAPVFLIQAENDWSLGPSKFLGPVLDEKGPPNSHKLYPAFYPELGHKSGHGGFALWPEGIAVWSPDVLPFLAEAIDSGGKGEMLGRGMRRRGDTSASAGAQGWRRQRRRHNQEEQ